MAKKGLNRAVIVDAAAELVEARGLENVTLHELAAALGIKTASLYNHLQGMPELSARLTELALKRLLDTLDEVVRNRTGIPALLALADAYRRFAREQPQMYKAMLRLPQFAGTSLLELKERFMHRFRDVLAPYQMSEEEQIHCGRMIRSALHGFVSLEAAGFFQNAVDAEKSYAYLTRHLAEMLAQKGEMPDGSGCAETEI